MSRFLVSALGAAVLLGLITAVAIGGQPDPLQSGPAAIVARVGVSPKNLTVDPSALYAFVYVLRDNTGAPVEGFPASQVELDFGGCFEPSTRPQTQIPADGPSDASGNVVWSVNLNWGGSDPCAVNVLVQNVIFTTLDDDSAGGGVRSPDENGDGVVAVNDLSVFQQAFVSGGPPYHGDLGPVFDDVTAVNDLSTFQKHFVAP